MRVLLTMALLAIVVAAMGCSSNHSAADVTGPLATTASLTAGAPPTTPPTASPALFGKVSDYNAGSFTLTTQNGKTYAITLAANTVVRFEGGTSDVATSALANGEMVTVIGTPIGLPSQAKQRATLVVINNGYNNQQVMTSAT